MAAKSFQLPALANAVVVRLPKDIADTEITTYISATSTDGLVHIRTTGTLGESGQYQVAARVPVQVYEVCSLVGHRAYAELPVKEMAVLLREAKLSTDVDAGVMLTIFYPPGIALRLDRTPDMLVEDTVVEGAAV